MEETFDRFAALFNITSKPRVILTEREQSILMLSCLAYQKSEGRDNMSLSQF